MGVPFLECKNFSWLVRKLFGKWIPKTNPWVSDFWPEALEAMSSRVFVVSRWPSRSLFHAGVCHHRTEACEASRLDDVTFQYSLFHVYVWAVNAIAGWSFCKLCGFMTSDCSLVGKNWQKTCWWQLLRMTQSGFLLHSRHISVFSDSICLRR